MIAEEKQEQNNIEKGINKGSNNELYDQIRMIIETTGEYD